MKRLLLFLLLPVLLPAQDIKEIALKNASEEICLCVQKIDNFDKPKREVNQEIKKCIDQQVTVYQTFVGLANAKDKDSSRIQISTDPESASYRKFYKEIESYSYYNCEDVKRLTGSNDEVQVNSISTNEKAVKLYEEGTELMGAKKYEKAVQKLRKAVEIDPKFAWAWDHLGLTYRYMGQFDKAIEAYETSLVINPDGQLPAQNLAIVYEYTENFDRALYYYEHLQQRYPDNPEGFYGAARMHLTLENLEAAADNIATAFRMYVETNSPYRADAEQIVGIIFRAMKAEGNEEKFYEIFEKHNIELRNE